jgi:hypothetical protein
MSTSHDLGCIILFAKNYRFSSSEVEEVRNVYFRHTLDYRNKNPEPTGIEARLNYSDEVKQYAYAATRQYIIKKIDSEQTRLEL